MRIISNKFEYYDLYNSHAKDDPVIFERKYKSIWHTNDETQWTKYPIDLEDEELLKNLRFFRFGRESLRYNLFSFCGVPYFTVRKTDENGNHYFKTYNKEDMLENNRWALPIGMISFLENKNFDRLLHIHKKLNSPILQIGLNAVTINELPIHFAEEVPAEEAYQKIESFISNELREQMAMSKMTNNEKIVSHGFSVKTSFRGNSA